MLVSEFDYLLPRSLVAKYPLKERDSSRLLILSEDSVSHDVFWNIASYLERGDVLVVNDTKVIPARLYGETESGAKVEVFLSKKLSESQWEVIGKPLKRLKEGKLLTLEGNIKARVLKVLQGKRVLEFLQKDYMERIKKFGHVPLPPYIERKEREFDRHSYQTVFADKNGAVAAPTAGLHFTRRLIEELKKKGVKIAKVTLHVGLGTFKPVKVRKVQEHKMESESFFVPLKSAELIRAAKSEGKRVIAVGTTVVRTLESSFDSSGNLIRNSGDTDLFIYPGYNFKVVDALITNFHLPKSTLIMLVSAFAGRKRVLNAYREAVKKGYRFYSYGDAMFIPKRLSV